MIATEERSLIWRHSSKPSTSGSIRSSSTMSGSSVSSSCRVRTPSAETTVSKPLTARFDRNRSTMFGSSSTTSARVFAAYSNTASSGPPLPGCGCCAAAVARPRLGGGRHWPGGPAVRPVRHFDRKMDQETGPLRGFFQHDTAPVCFDDSLGYGQPEPGARGRCPAPAHRLEGRDDHVGRHPGTVIVDVDRDPARSGRRGDDVHSGAGRIVAESVVQQVHEDLLQAIMVGPYDRGGRS